MSLSAEFLPHVIQRFTNYKELGDKTFEQLNEQDFFFQPSTESNSIAVIIQHFYGNTMSRWTNFLTEDGEKEWRKRDAEFEVKASTKQDLLMLWNDAWKLILDTLQSLTGDDLTRTIYIRTAPLLVFDAILRQLQHYPYHVGQVVYIGKMIKNENFKSLSIPKGKSNEYNQTMKR